MPARIYPLPFAQHEDLSDAAGLVDSPAACLQFVRIIRVHHSGVAINLDFGFGKLELEKLAAAFCELGRAIKNRLTVRPGVVAGLDGDCLFRDQLFERRAIAGEVSAPDGLASIEQTLLHLIR